MLDAITALELEWMIWQGECTAVARKTQECWNRSVFHSCVIRNVRVIYNIL